MGADTISELFTERSSEYSDRPRPIFSQDLVGLSALHPMTQYGEDFKQQRRFIKEVPGADVIRKPEALPDEEGRSSIATCNGKFSSSLSLRLVYGLEAMEINDPHELRVSNPRGYSHQHMHSGCELSPWEFLTADDLTEAASIQVAEAIIADFDMEAAIGQAEEAALGREVDEGKISDDEDDLPLQDESPLSYFDGEAYL
ncbi:hypothetical protein NEOLEDRAFT_1184290, partial [Neolentinus lepideus HHB14362 ss-1]